MVTKWDVLKTRLDAARQHVADMQAEMLGMIKTPLKTPCSACGKVLWTEAEFAQHFIVPDTRYLNVGYCPSALSE